MQVSNLIYAEPPVTALRRDGASHLLVETDGKWTAYNLKSSSHVASFL